MGRRIDAIKRLQESTPQEVMAGYLWNFVLNSKDHFWKTKYYEFTAYFELNTDNGTFTLDVLYCGQETSFLLSTFMKKMPDYKSVLAITEQLLCWLENTYSVYMAGLGPVVQNEPKRTRGRTVASQQQRGQSGAKMGPGNAPNQAPSKGQRRRS